MIVTHVNKPHTAYIGRGSCPKRDGCVNLHLGNPYTIGKDGARAEVIAKYRDYFLLQLETDPLFKQRVLEASEHTCACYCKPNDCHGDVIKGYLELRKIVRRPP